MGLLNYFKKNTRQSTGGITKSKSIDDDSHLLGTLKTRLIGLGYQVDIHPMYRALIINSEIEIATLIIENPDSHPAILQLMIITSHPKYLPNGIKENIAGIGTTIQDKINSAIDNFINTTFLPIIDSFSDSHNAELDFYTFINGKKVLWHPKLGNLSLQGQWNEPPLNEPFFEIIKDKLETKLTSDKLNWVKLYISKQADGTLIGECLFNNEPWVEGLACITAYAKSWELRSKFQGLKQFIIFRKCDAYDG